MLNGRAEPKIGDVERRFCMGTASHRAATQGPRGASASSRASEISGYGALFNSETVIGMWFREVILPGAFAESLKQDDIRIAFNHDHNYILGRTSARTATVTEDKKGLRYVATPPASRADVVESIERGDITGSSFVFSVENPEDEEWDYTETKKGLLPLRTIKRARLYETGPVAFPAYEDTTVSAGAAQRAAAGIRASGGAVPLDLLERELDLLELEASVLPAAAPAKRYTPGPLGVLERELDELEQGWL